MDSFIIELLDQFWCDKDINNLDDFCSHGEVLLVIGEYEVLNKDNGDWTVASAALRLMKSALFGYDSQSELPLISCCGYLLSLGCPNSASWNVKIIGDKIQISHLEHSCNEKSKREVFEGIFEVDLIEYSKQVLSFAKRVKRFYNVSKPRIINDKYYKDEYDTYWNEFEKLFNLLRERCKR